MCTVTYLPVTNGYVFTTNRDETVTRGQTVFPQYEKIGGQRVCFPADPQAHGSWIAVGDKRLVCLLNGGFEKHRRELPYRV